MFMPCDRFKANSGKSFAGQSCALARVTFEHGRHMRRGTQYCVASSGRTDQFLGIDRLALIRET